MKKSISMLLAILMVLGLIMGPGVFSVSASAEEAAGPVVLKFHYSRKDGAYDDWDLYTWGSITGAAPFVEENGEMVATVYAHSNTSSVGFIVLQGGDSWKVKDPDGDRKIDVSDVLEIAYPLRNEASRHFKVKRKSEEILHLSREDGKGNTAGESHYDRIRDELEDDTHLAHSHHHEEDTRHDRSDDKALHSVLSDNAGNNHDERTGRSSDKEVRSSKERDEESRYNCSDETLLRGHAAGNTECDCKRKGDDTDDQARDKVRCELL